MKRFSDEYLAYINSREWHAKRAGRLIAAQFSCERCHSPHGLQVHHKTYRNLGNEPPEDLMVLCGICHKQQHLK